MLSQKFGLPHPTISYNTSWGISTVSVHKILWLGTNNIPNRRIICVNLYIYIIKCFDKVISLIREIKFTFVTVKMIKLLQLFTPN